MLIAASAIGALGFLGSHSLLRVLYILRLGHGPEYLGIFSAAGAWAYSAMSVPSGALGSRFGGRPMMRVGFVIVGLGMILLTMSEVVPAGLRLVWPILSQVVTIAGWSLFNINVVPALMTVTTARNRNNTYALHSALRGLGAFLGTLLGGWLPGMVAPLLGDGLDAPGPYRVSLLASAVAVLVALLPLYLVQVRHVAPVSRTKVRGRFPFALVIPVAIYIGLNHAGWATCRAFCSAYMDQDLGLTPSAIGQLTGVGQLIGIGIPLLMPRLVRRRSSGWVVVVATLGIAGSLLPIGLIPNSAGAGVGRIGVLAFSAIRMPALQVFQMELVDEAWRSLSYGVGSMAMSFGFGSMSLAGGYTIAALGYRTIFFIGAGLCTLAALWLALFLGRRRQGETPNATE